jgi:hypothetical protein
MEQPNQQRGPREEEQRRQKRQERREQREEAVRQNQRPEHEIRLEERQCERPRCVEIGATIEHRCRKCNAEACGDCKESGKHQGRKSSCNPDTWERAPTRSDYTIGRAHVGLKIRNKFDDGSRRGEVHGYLSHRGEKWYLVKWDFGQEMEIDEDMFTGCRLAEEEHKRDEREPEQSTVEQGRLGYRPPEPRRGNEERKREKEGENDDPPALEEPQHGNTRTEIKTKETRKDRAEGGEKMSRNRNTKPPGKSHHGGSE